MLVSQNGRLGPPGDATSFAMALSATLLSGTSQTGLARVPSTLVLPTRQPQEGMAFIALGTCQAYQPSGAFLSSLSLPLAIVGHFKLCQSCWAVCMMFNSLLLKQRRLKTPCHSEMSLYAPGHTAARSPGYSEHPQHCLPRMLKSHRAVGRC